LLDATGRELLGDLLEELGTGARVLLIAQDPRVIPASFDVVRCHAGVAAPESPGVAVDGQGPSCQAVLG
jgi:hypothetical protein